MQQQPTQDPVAEAQADVQRMLAAAASPPPYRTDGYGNDPEQTRDEARKLVWLTQNHWVGDYRARTWGYAILRTTHTDNGAFERAVDALRIWVRWAVDREVRRVTEILEKHARRLVLPEGRSATANPTPSDEFVARFVNDVVEDRAALNDTTTTAQVCAYFKTWSLARWHMDERLFSAASPRLKTAILFDDETIAQLQALPDELAAVDADEENGGARRAALSRKFWVKMVEAEPRPRSGPGSELVDCYCVRLLDLIPFWFARDRMEPASFPWARDERFPGQWCVELN